MKLGLERLKNGSICCKFHIMTICSQNYRDTRQSWIMTEVTYLPAWRWPTETTTPISNGTILNCEAFSYIVVPSIFHVTALGVDEGETSMSASGRLGRTLSKTTARRRLDKKMQEVSTSRLCLIDFVAQETC